MLLYKRDAINLKYYSADEPAVSPPPHYTIGSLSPLRSSSSFWTWRRRRRTTDLALLHHKQRLLWTVCKKAVIYTHDS